MLAPPNKGNAVPPLNLSKGSSPVPSPTSSPRGRSNSLSTSQEKGKSASPGDKSPRPGSSPRPEDKPKPVPTVPFDQRILTHPERIGVSQEEVLRIDGVNIWALEKGQLSLIDEKTSIVFHRTNIEEVIAIQVGCLHIFSNVGERPTLRPYRNYYVLSEGGHFFAIEIPKDLSDEDVMKLELMFYYYSRFVRMQGIRPGEETKIVGNAGGKGTSVVASALEGGSRGLAKVFVVAGTGIAKGAKGTSDFYCKHRKAYAGPEGLTEEQKARLENDDTVTGKVEGVTEDLVRGTGAVVLGVKNGFRFIGEKVSAAGNSATKPVKNTEWYQKKEEKKKAKKEEKEKQGIKEEGGVFSGIGDIAKTGWGAINTVKDGFEKGMVAAGTGVRDASVQATRHADGDYAAELSKQRWNAVGNVGQTFQNALSLLKDTSTWWVKLAMYTGNGVVTYDADLPIKISGPGWWEGWVAYRGELSEGLGWRPAWAVVRTHLVALYKSPEIACTDAEDTMIRPIKFSSLRTVTIGQEADFLAGRSNALVVEKAKKRYFLSTNLNFDLSVDYVHPSIPTGRPKEKEEEDLHNLVDMMETFVEFLAPDRVRAEKRKKEKEQLKKQEKKVEKEKLKEAKEKEEKEKEEKEKEGGGDNKEKKKKKGLFGLL